MRFYKNIVVSSGIKNVNKVKRMLHKRIAVYDVYCVCVRNDSENLMDIIASTQIFKQHHEGIDYLVIGIADSKQEAFELVANIIEEHIGTGEELSSFKNIYLEG